MSEVELGAGAFWWLMAVGGLSGFLSLVWWNWSLRHLADGARVTAAANAMIAHLLEFRLFADEPALIVRAQINLLRANVRWLWLLAGPLAGTTLLFAAILPLVDGFFGHAALQPGQAAVVTAHFRGTVREAQLRTGKGFLVETPPVRVRSRQETSWRVSGTRAARGQVELTNGALQLERTLWCQRGLHWVPERKWFWSNGVVDWMKIGYPPALVFGQHWLVWFSAAACGGALASMRGVIRG